MLGLERATVVITGATGNLGIAAVDLFAEVGANLVIVARQAEAVERLAARFGPRALGVAVDLLDPAATQEMVARALTRFGRVDVLFNAVGGFAGGKPLHEEPAETWDRLYALNLRTVLNACRAVVPLMIEQRSGCILNTASHGALAGAPGLAAYAATKSMVIRLTESLAAELAPFGVRVNALAPTTLDTPENRAAMPEVDPSHWVNPRSVAELALLLCAHHAEHVSGAVLPIEAKGR